MTDHDLLAVLLATLEEAGGDIELAIKLARDRRFRGNARAQLVRFVAEAARGRAGLSSCRKCCGSTPLRRARSAGANAWRTPSPLRLTG
jgi:hypothetical protein